MEKRLSVSIKKIVGQPNPKEGKWSGVLVFEPEDERLERQRGQLFAVLDLTGSGSFNLGQFGKLTLETLREAYYASEEPSPLQALEEAIHKAQHQLVELVFGPGGAVPDSALNYNFSAAALWGTVLYLAKLGASGLYLYRQNVIEELGETKDGKVFSASGMVRDGDAAILGSSDFRRTFSVGELPEALGSLDSLVENLGRPSGISALVLGIDLRSVPGEEEELRIAPVVGKPSFFAKLQALLPRRQKVPEVYIEREEGELRLQKKRKIPKVLVFATLLIFLAASAFTIRKRQRDFRAAEAEKLLSSAEQTLSDALAYVDLNNSRARELFLKAREDFEAAKDFGGEVLGLSEKIEEINTLLDQVNKVKRVELEVVEEATVSFDPLSELDSPPEVGDSVVDAGTYFGNVYFLVPSENQILKSVPAGDEYSTAKYWVTEENPPLADAVAMAIDGFIYVLKSDGNVLKFEKGELVTDFRLKELDRPLSDPRAIFATVDSEHLYILDAGNQRIVVTDKNGLYQSQYIYEEGLVDPKDLFVDEAGGAIYLLDEAKIYRIEI